MNLSIVILAAGFGTRMKSKLPKVLHRICGKPMIEYLVDESLKLSDDVTIITYHGEELIKEHLNNYKTLNFITQDIKNFPGTGGAIKDINPKHEKILLLNGDMPLVSSTDLEAFLNEDSDINLGVIDIDNPSGYGRVIIQDKQIKRIVEQKDASKKELEVTTINTGVYLFKRDILKKYQPKLTNNNAQNEYYITDIIGLAKAENKIISPIYVGEDSFMGVNSPYELSSAELIMANKIKANLMQSGTKMRLPQSIYIESTVSIDEYSSIENGVSILGNTVIKNTHIKANSYIQDSTIINSSIGPMANIRPNSNISDSHIGNFVEVKNSTLNTIKAGHLSYLGDSDINEGTNIGAGTITCNYDGKNKYKTTIGKNVFIGSDTQIVAPVNISDDTIIAAGSTITKDTTKGDLAISRTRQTNIKNFFYKFFNKNT
ncbi:MAG: N-acetylglucosamine-1-phosphate uridyltransferase (EC / Glucosamine-1-phosphate N-acetyltransferase (EC [uncultured Campylobacterales bacterium]|uniref:Bifunctional protein GlmU n=1 Tax=uncultured Campylobacterales bacterium TaxID=352960 RepID=A0A6S6SRX6_9BACT|nr:MAG: N-acetylglucosamine-1-phosphate uridyltransferase (EC / Glucosamine-1-phosphate N-acetyltransferase (EC [uncultured Campylobacterales bacterium]